MNEKETRALLGRTFGLHHSSARIKGRDLPHLHRLALANIFRVHRGLHPCQYPHRDLSSTASAELNQYVNRFHQSTPSNDLDALAPEEGDFHDTYESEQDIDDDRKRETPAQRTREEAATGRSVRTQKKKAMQDKRKRRRSERLRKEEEEATNQRTAANEAKLHRLRREEEADGRNATREQRATAAENDFQDAQEEEATTPFPPISRPRAFQSGVNEGDIVSIMPQDSAVATTIRITGMDRFDAHGNHLDEEGLLRDDNALVAFFGPDRRMR